MKNLLFICLLFLFGALTPNNAIANTIPSTNPVEEVGEKPINISIKVDFGRKKKNCRGFGICSITVDIDIDFPLPFPYASNGGAGMASSVKGNLVLDIDKSSMTVETMARFLSEDTFEVDEDFTISRDLMKSLGLRNAVVKAGTYDVEDVGSCLRIRF